MPDENATEAALAAARDTADSERKRADAARATADAERVRATKLEREVNSLRDEMLERSESEGATARRIVELQAKLEAQSAEHANALDAARAATPLGRIKLAGVKVRPGAGRVLNAAEVRKDRTHKLAVRVYYGGVVYLIDPNGLEPDAKPSNVAVRLAGGRRLRKHTSTLALNPAMLTWWREKGRAEALA